MRFLLALAAAALTAGCTSAGTVTIAPFSPTPAAAALRCGWYTPMTGKAYGQVVTVTVTGPGCRSQALIRWIALRSGKPWASEGPGVHPGTVVAQLAQGGTVVQIWQDGSAPATDGTAGGLADAFTGAGWRVEQPVCGAGGCGPPVTPPESTLGG